MIIRNFTFTTYLLQVSVEKITLEIDYIVINRLMITSRCIVIEDEVKAKIDTLINAKKYQSNKSKNRESH